MINRLLDIDLLEAESWAEIKKHRMFFEQVENHASMLRLMHNLVRVIPLSENDKMEEAVKTTLIESIFYQRTRMLFVDYRTVETTHKLIRSQQREPDMDRKIGSWKVSRLVELVRALEDTNVNVLFREWLKVAEKKKSKKVKVGSDGKGK